MENVKAAFILERKEVDSWVKELRTGGGMGGRVLLLKEERSWMSQYLRRQAERSRGWAKEMLRGVLREGYLPVTRLWTGPWKKSIDEETARKGKRGG